MSAVMRAFGREPTHEETILWGRAGFGTVYGIAISPANLVVVPALGLTPPSWEFPIETTVRGIGYHVAYGVAFEVQARVLRLHDAG